jgi:ABC-type amino acid transport substrate-binding protein
MRKTQTALLLIAMSMLVTCFSEATFAETREISIGACAFPKPFQWVDENGKLQGYEIEVAEEIARRANLKLNWSKNDFGALFLGLDANMYQVVVGTISYTPERAEKYLYPEEYYARGGVVIAVRKGVTGIKSIDDLAGKRVPIGTGSSTHAVFLQKYNEDHPDAQINLVLTDEAGGSSLIGLIGGLFDAAVTTEIEARETIRAHGDVIDFVELPPDVAEQIFPTKSYFLFSKSNDELRKKWDKALRNIIDDGTLSALALKFFERDYSR